MLLCAAGTSKNLVHGALIEAEILAPPLLHVFPQLSPVLGAGTLSKGLSMHPKWSRNVLCVSGTSKTILVHEALIEVEILTSQLPHVFPQLSPILGAGTLPPDVSTPLKWSKMFLCVSEKKPTKIWCMGTNRS